MALELMQHFLRKSVGFGVLKLVSTEKRLFGDTDDADGIKHSPESHGRHPIAHRRDGKSEFNGRPVRMWYSDRRHESFRPDTSFTRGSAMRQTRRRFVFQVLGGSLGIGALTGAKWSVAAESLPTGDVALTDIRLGEGVLEYLDRTQGGFNPEKYRQILGAANEFKEGDVTIGVAAADHASRRFARSLLSATSIGAIDAHPILNDGLHQYLAANRPPLTDDDRKMTLGELKALLLTEPEPAVKSLCARLPSDVIGCVVKLMSNDELVAVGAKVFHALPGSQIGARGYLGARIQPNSPTDNVDDIRWQVFDGWSYAVGDVLLGTNPVSSDPQSVAAVESTLRDVLATFGVVAVLPHCVLAHIDVQAEVEQRHPGSTALWFQSIAGNDAANKTFDISVEKMVEHE